MQSYLPEVQNYLNTFFRSRISQYEMAYKHLQPQEGYGFYYKHDEVTQTLFDIVANIGETFWDLRIPEAFSSPEELLKTLIKFQDYLSKQNILFKDVFAHHEVEQKDTPEPVFEIYRINNEILNAINHVLSLDEAKVYLSEKKYEGVIIDEAVDRLTVICKRFHLVAKQLEKRHSDKGKIRQTLKINDEYDVQDLLDALLRIDFEDVRKEEPTPSYIGGSSRMDFLLKSEKIAVEVKKTRESLKDKEIGEELLADIGRYTSHRDCEYLLFFVYDPDHHLKNPEGLIRDLSNYGNDKLNVRVVVNPL